ncbi:MAG: prepilin peptidase, partial [Sulfuricella sp.]|nr:prepilin peptidase [Sulfuricella sp.]
MPVFALFTQNPLLFVGVASLFGLLLGSFLNVVIHRVPRMLEREWQEQCAWVEGKTR